MISEFKKQNGVDLGNDKMALQRLKEAAEKAKKELSASTTTNINLPFISMNADGPLHFDMNLTRAKFDELARLLQCQFITATHSPFMLGTLHAKIYNIDTKDYEVAKWSDLDNVRRSQTVRFL